MKYCGGVMDQVPPSHIISHVNYDLKLFTRGLSFLVLITTNKISSNFFGV